MTKSEALVVLSVNSSSAHLEEIKEAYEEAVFEQASFFMRRVFIPKLASARISKLETIELAANVLGLETNEVALPSTHFDFNSTTSHEDILERYNRAETQIKLRLANTLSAARAIDLFRAWIQLFNAYAQSFLFRCELRDRVTQVRLTNAPIFVEYKNASDSERLELIRNECARLTKLRD